MIYEEGNRMSCPLHYTLSILDGKWKPYIIWYLAPEDEPVDYARLRDIVPYNISHKVFSQQLKELVSDGIIMRFISENNDTDEAPRISYALSPKGRSLCGLLHALSDWGFVHGDYADRSAFSPEGERIAANKVAYSAWPRDAHGRVPEAYVWVWDPSAQNGA